MSWEGYEQIICENGHYYQAANDMVDPCPVCKGKAAWNNIVDETNCDSYGEIPYALLKKKYLISEEVRETCNLGHSHITKHAVFRVPDWEETKRLQHHRPDYGGTPLVPLYPDELLKDPETAC